MKKFILTRKIQDTEEAQVEAEDFTAAREMFQAEGVVWTHFPDGEITDETIEYIGDC